MRRQEDSRGQPEFSDLPNTPAQSPATPRASAWDPSSRDPGDEAWGGASYSEDSEGDEPRQNSHKTAEDIWREQNRDLLGYDKQEAASSLEDSTTKRVEKGWCDGHVLHPNKPFRVIFNAFQVAFLMWVGIMVPYRIGFSVEVEAYSGMWWWEVVVDSYFFIDLLLNFFTGYVDDDEAVEMRPAKICYNYATSWFLIDLISCLPVQYLILAFESSVDSMWSNTKALKALRLLRLAKLLRLSKARDYLSKFEESVAQYTGVAKGLGYLVLICEFVLPVLQLKFCACGRISGPVRSTHYCLCAVYACHLIGCLWFYVGKTSVKTVDEDPEGNWPDGWIKSRGVEDAALEMQYLTSFYWALTVLTTVGFGDIGPSTPAEIVFSCMAEMAGCFIFAILMGSIAAVLTGEQVLKLKVDQQMAELTEYLRRKDIRPSLRTKIRVFMEDVYEDHAFDEQEMLDELPAELRDELQSELHEEWKRKVCFLGHNIVQSDLNIVPVLCNMLSPRIEMENKDIYQEDSVGQELYVIMEGAVTLHSGGTLDPSITHEVIDSRSDMYYRRLVGYMKDPEGKKERLCNLKLKELRGEARKAGIDMDRFKKTETDEERREEMQNLTLEKVKLKALAEGKTQSEINHAIQPVQKALINLLVAAEKERDSSLAGYGEHLKRTELEGLPTDQLMKMARENHEYIPENKLIEVMAAYQPGRTSEAKELAKEALIALILGEQTAKTRPLGAVMGQAVSHKMAATSRKLGSIDEDSAFEKAKMQQQQRNAIIDEMCARPGTIFGERELFFARRNFNQATASYSVRGKDYSRLPVEGRYRHQTATVTSPKKASLLYMNWKCVYELHRHHGAAGRRVFEFIHRIAKEREKEDNLNFNQQALAAKLKMISKRQNAAVVLQNAWRRMMAKQRLAAEQKDFEKSQTGRALGILIRKHMHHDELRSHLTSDVHCHAFPSLSIIQHRESLQKLRAVSDAIAEEKRRRFPDGIKTEEERKEVQKIVDTQIRHAVEERAKILTLEEGAGPVLRHTSVEHHDFVRKQHDQNLKDATRCSIEHHDFLRDELDDAEQSLWTGAVTTDDAETLSRIETARKNLQEIGCDHPSKSKEDASRPGDFIAQECKCHARLESEKELEKKATHVLYQHAIVDLLAEKQMEDKEAEWRRQPGGQDMHKVIERLESFEKKLEEVRQQSERSWYDRRGKGLADENAEINAQLKLKIETQQRTHDSELAMQLAARDHEHRNVVRELEERLSEKERLIDSLMNKNRNMTRRRAVSGQFNPTTPARNSHLMP